MEIEIGDMVDVLEDLIGVPAIKIASMLNEQDVRPSEVVMLAEVGSTAHGISASETGDDYDFTLVRMERFTELINGPEKRQSMMVRTKPEGVRSEAGDIDLNVYTLRKFVKLASNGNPSILTALFSKNRIDDLGLVPGRPKVNFGALATLVKSARAGQAFLGYMTQQMDRWEGKATKRVSRPELIEKYGFDTKYAAHVIRLGYQGIEYMETGRFSVPMGQDQAQRIIDLRLGHLSEDEAREWAESVRVDLLASIGATELPPEPNREAIEVWLKNQYQNWYLKNP